MEYQLFAPRHRMTDLPYTLVVDDHGEASATWQQPHVFLGSVVVTTRWGQFLGIDVAGEPFTEYGVTYQYVIVRTAAKEFGAYRRVDGAAAHHPERTDHA